MNNVKVLFEKVSIKTRLAFLYSLAAFVLLTVIALFLYWQTVNILYRTDYRFLRDEVETIQYIMSNKPFNLEELKQAVISTPTQTGRTLYRYYVRLFDENEKLIIETPDINPILPAQKSINHKTQLLHKVNFHWFKKNHKSYLLIQAPMRLNNQKLGLIEIVLDISYQHAAINDRRTLIIALLASALCSIFLGFVISRRGMRSLDELTETVRTITAKSLNQRIDPQTLPVDLAKLGHAFNQMLDRVEQSFIRLKQFSSDLAHELRIPITNLIGQTEIALTRNQSENEYKQLLESNLEEFERVSHLIENILFLARAENPQINLQKTAIDLSKELAVISEYYQPIADDKNIKITHKGSAELHANSVMIRRMFSNILSNALKYTPQNGSVHFDIQQNSDGIKIVAADSGIGIAPEHIKKIFDRFYRVDSARNQETGGVGLGLAIVKSIVQMHRGQIELASEVNVGTTITIHLP